MVAFSDNQGDRALKRLVAVTCSAETASKWRPETGSAIKNSASLRKIWLVFPRSLIQVLSCRISPIIDVPVGASSSATWSRQPGREYISLQIKPFVTPELATRTMSRRTLSGLKLQRGSTAQKYVSSSSPAHLKNYMIKKSSNLSIH
jgi:hypothetical protein